MQCDYLLLVKRKKELNSHSSKKKNETSAALVELLGKGRLLPEISYEWLDPIKTALTNEVASLLLKYLQQTDSNKQSELAVKTAETLFLWDSLNEEGLRIILRLLSQLGRHGTAKTVYETFAAEYLSIYDKPFPVTLKELLS